MAFVWTEDISVGASIDKADIEEIRDNTDWLDDQGACDAYDAARDLPVDDPQYSGRDSGQDVSMLSGQYTSRLSSQVTSRLNDQHTSYCNDQHVTYKSFNVGKF